MYFLRFTVPKNTPITGFYQTIIPFAQGYLERFRLVFPTGCADLVGVWVEYRTHKILPVNDDGYFVGNGGVIDFELDYELLKPPFELTVKAYNDDDTFDHSPTIGFKIRFVGSFEDEKDKKTELLKGLAIPGRD